MPVSHAQNFVENFFEDDEFLKEVLRHRGFERHENNSEEAENERMAKIADKMGFKFDVEEYKMAIKEYANNLGGWESMKKVFHMMKIATNVANEKNN